MTGQSSKESAVICCGGYVLLISFIFIFIPQYSIFAAVIFFLTLIVILALWAGAKQAREKQQFERQQMAKGLVKFVDRTGQERWGFPEEVEGWKMSERGLVKYKGKWMTPEKKRERFEREQMAKGFVKFVDLQGRERWGTPEQVKNWKTAYILPYGITTTKLAEQITNYIKKTSREALLESRQLRRLFLTEKLIAWALERNLMRVTRTHVKLFLMDNGIKLDMPTEQMLYQQVKLKYRYLPPWMRK